MGTLIRNQRKIPTKETESAEFKKSLAERSEILECVSAFANTKGGRIYIGVEPSGKIIGVEIGNNTIENLANEIKQNTDPKVFPSIEVLKVKSKDIISLFVPEYPSKPVWAKDKVFIRVGRTNQKASADTIGHFIKDQHAIKWDKTLFSKASIKDISQNKIKLFIEKASVERNTVFEGTINIKNILQSLNLIENNSLTNASILLFSKNPQ
ncbi:MAG: putative DNA binding domain-containing protein, partial [Bacteroidetes bacterium]|nr:putative DNA binding domain-containing protein [Bacteroidota bacterium]